MFRLAGGETWLDGLSLLDPDTGHLNYGAVIFVNRWCLGLPLSAERETLTPDHSRHINPTT